MKKMKPHTSTVVAVIFWARQKFQKTCIVQQFCLSHIFFRCFALLGFAFDLCRKSKWTVFSLRMTFSWMWVKWTATVNCISLKWCDSENRERLKEKNETRCRVTTDCTMKSQLKDKFTRNWSSCVKCIETESCYCMVKSSSNIPRNRIKDAENRSKTNELLYTKRQGEKARERQLHDKWCTSSNHSEHE